MYFTSEDSDAEPDLDDVNPDSEDREDEESAADDAGFACAGCGQWNETTVDASAGRRQSYVEDCQVCCKPNVLHITWDQGEEAYRIESELES